MRILFFEWIYYILFYKWHYVSMSEEIFGNLYVDNALNNLEKNLYLSVGKWFQKRQFPDRELEIATVNGLAESNTGNCGEMSEIRGTVHFQTNESRNEDQKNVFYTTKFQKHRVFSGADCYSVIVKSFHHGNEGLIIVPKDLRTCCYSLLLNGCF